MQGRVENGVPVYPHFLVCEKLPQEARPAADISAEPDSSAEATQPAASQLPAEIPHSTYHEARNAAIALSDGPALHRWQECSNGDGWFHQIDKREPLATKLTAASPVLDWWSLPKPFASVRPDIREELQHLQFPAVLLFNVALGLLLKEREVTVSLDDLISAIGWEPRSKIHRDSMRRSVWRWLMLFTALSVVGQRPGTYLDRRTKKRERLISVDSFLNVIGRRQADQLSLDGSEPPRDVTLVAGPWLNQYRGNGQILTTFSDVLRIAAIPSGRPSGAWAQAVGMALQQVWREQAASAIVEGAGDTLAVRFPRAFTRRQLLGMFRCDPEPLEVLASTNPERARLYWDDAIRKLEKAEVIAHYGELATISAGRQGWQDSWLDQPLDVRPGLAGARIVADVARAASHPSLTAARVRGKAG